MISLHYTSHTKAYNTIYTACNIVEAIYSFTQYVIYWMLLHFCAKKYPGGFCWQTERDISVRQRAVDLLYAMCGRGNVQTIVAEMLLYLETADYAIREEMVSCHFILHFFMWTFLSVYQYWYMYTYEFISAATSNLRYPEKVSDAVWALWQEWTSQLMPGEFLQQFLRMTGKGRQNVLTPPGWPLWRTTYHITASVWKMPPSWHWTDHFGGYWQQAELHTQLMQAEQWWWWCYRTLWWISSKGKKGKGQYSSSWEPHLRAARCHLSYGITVLPATRHKWTHPA